MSVLELRKQVKRKDKKQTTSSYHLLILSFLYTENGSYKNVCKNQIHKVRI